MAKMRQVVNRVIVCELSKVQFRRVALCIVLFLLQTLCPVQRVKLTVEQHWIQNLFMIFFGQISQLCKYMGWNAGMATKWDRSRKLERSNGTNTGGLWGHEMN
jgi:hypothetical protein